MWIEENVNGLRDFLKMRKAEQNHQVEKVGEQLRAMMLFIRPKRLQNYDPS